MKPKEILLDDILRSIRSLEEYTQQAISEEKEKTCKWIKWSNHVYYNPHTKVINKEYENFIYCPFCGLKIERKIENKIIISDIDPYGEENWNDDPIQNEDKSVSDALREWSDKYNKATYWSDRPQF